MRASKAAVVASIAVVIVLLGAGLFVVPRGPPVGAERAPSAPSSTAPLLAHPSTAKPAIDLAGNLRSMEQTLRARGVPASDFHPPRLIRTPGAHVPVSPTYTTGPAPMGLSDLGLRNVSGSLVPYDYNTSSVWGSVTLTKAVVAYVDGDGPDTFGIQLDAVATNVTLLGTRGYQFWTQDYLSYTPSTQSLTFGDNVWNFSNASARFPKDVLWSYGSGGRPVAPVYYFAVGPSYKIAYPFTVNLYLNATHVGGRPAVYFNYSIAQGGVWVEAHGSFDHVVFNSSLGSTVLPAQAPAFQVNGTGVGPSGLPNDLELDLVGNDQGDTTTFFAISATMSLEYWSHAASRYRTVPAAFDAGSETGETSDGLLPVTNLSAPSGVPSATLRTGPSFVSGLWNVSRALDGARGFRVNQHPQNAFLFVNPGSTFNASSAQWVPTQHFGTTTSDFWLPNSGTFTLEWMLSDRTTVTYLVTELTSAANSTTAFTERLPVSAAAGSYTPLFAWGNGDLLAISQHGNGTAAAPYVLIHHPVGPLNPVFGQLNDYGFPVFAGVLLINTTAIVHVLQPDVAMTYGGWEYAELRALHLPTSNELQLEFWNVSNVTVENSTGLGGWLTYNFDFFPAGAVVLWGSSGNLVANNTFYDQGASIALYGGRSNTIWGNRFLAGAVSAWFYEGNNTTGVLEAESGDLVYNNYFAVGQPAVTPTLDPYSCQVVCLPASYEDRWNVSLEPANASAVVLGFLLTGSIVRTTYQGGNYWSNYGTPSDPLGVLPYNDGGLITNGGDYYPLYPTQIYAVTFVAHGLVPGSSWSVSVAGLTLTTTAATQVFHGTNGTYNYTVVAPGGFVGPIPGTFELTGANLMVELGFIELFRISVGESGLAPDLEWNVSFSSLTPGGTSGLFASHTTTGQIELENGTYQVVPTAYGYVGTPTPSFPTDDFVVDGTALSIGFHFAIVPLLSVTASGLPSGVAWTVSVDQGSLGSTTLTGIGDVTVVFTALELFPGPYTWSVSASGFSSTPASGSGSSPTPTYAGVLFASTSSSSSSPGLSPWEIGFFVALAVAVVAIALAALAYLRRPRAPQPISPAAVTAAGAPAGSPPWEENATDAENPEPYTSRR